MRNLALLASFVAAAGCSDYYPVTIVVADGGTPSAPGSRSTVDAAQLGDGGRDAGLDSSALAPVVDASVPTEDAAPPDELPHDAGAVVEPVPDAASASDSSITPADSGPAGCPNQDGDALCDAVDACPYDAPNDSDGDGVCDSSDACAGKNDYADADSDGTPDGCDTCPGKSDSDGDSNGYADACDQVLWAIDEPQQQLVSGVPFYTVKAEMLLARGDGVYVSTLVPIKATDSEVTVTDVVDVATALQQQWSGVPTEGRAVLRFTNANSSSGSGRVYLTFPAVKAPGSGWTIKRLRMFGHATLDGDVRMRWEVRGY